jgi:Tat protein secretion system quality control protein TatD with DNase activity
VEKKLLAMMTMQKVVAWGECGLDYFDKKTRGQALDFLKKVLDSVGGFPGVSVSIVYL